MTLVLVLMTKGVHAQDQGNIRAEIKANLRKAQEFIKNKNTEEAKKFVNAARNTVNLLPEEEVLIERIQLSVAVAEKNEVAALQSLELLQSSQNVPHKERRVFAELFLQLAHRAQKFDAVVKVSKRYFEEGGSSAAVRIAYVQSLAAINRDNDLLDFLNSRVNSGGDGEISEYELRQMAVSYSKLGNSSECYQTLKKLINRYSKDQYWSELVALSFSQDYFDSRYEVDAFLLLDEVGGMKSSGLINNAAESALKSGYPELALRWLDKQVDSEDKFSIALRAKAARQASEDMKMLASLEKSAVQSDELSELGNLHFSKGQWELASRSFERALDVGVPHKKETLLRLRLGISYLRSHQQLEAVKMLDSVQGEPMLKELAELWRLRNPT